MMDIVTLDSITFFGDVMRVQSDGQVFYKGKLVGNDKEVFERLQETMRIPTSDLEACGVEVVK